MTGGLLVLAAAAALIGGDWTASKGVPSKADVGILTVDGAKAEVLSGFSAVPFARFIAREDALIPAVHGLWKQTGDRACVTENWTALTNRIDGLAAKKGGDFLGACVWLLETRLMVELGPVQGGRWAYRGKKFVPMNLAAARHIRETYLAQTDGSLPPGLQSDQRALALALYLRLVAGPAAERTLAALCRDVESRGVRMDGVFNGETILLDTLAQFGKVDLAYRLVLRDPRPAYREWFWKCAAGLAADSTRVGFRNVLLAPHPHDSFAAVRAERPTSCGRVASGWRRAGARWIWEFTIPGEMTAAVTLPGETVSRLYDAGSHRIEIRDR